jgi:hypothetical protein
MFLAFVEFASAADKCPAAAANDVEEGYNSALSDKQDALEEGKRQLSQIREELERDSNGIGKTGSAQEATIAIALIARETTDLMELMGAIFEPGGTAIQREFLKRLKKLRKEVEAHYHAAEKLIDDDARDVLDQLPSFVPGIKLARDSKQWDAAKNEFSVQLANLDRAIDKLDLVLTSSTMRGTAVSGSSADTK